MSTRYSWSIRTVIIISTAFVALSNGQAKPSPTAAFGEPVLKGCYKSSYPLEDQGSDIYQTEGLCQKICAEKLEPVFAVVNGSNCWCGKLLPAKADKIDDAECNTPCNGFDKKFCGGNEVYHVYLTALNKNQIPHFDPSSSISSSSSTASSTPPPASGSSPTSETSKPTEESRSSGGGTSKAGVAAGSVVGVLAIAASIGGVLLFLRQRKRREAEKAYKNAAAVNSFIENGKRSVHTSSSMNDARLDPIVVQRRMSDGSIADNQDYSRRILQVTNPDYS